MIGINDMKAGTVEEPKDSEKRLHDIVEMITHMRPDGTLIVAQTMGYTVPTPAINLYNTYISDVLVPEYQIVPRG